MNVSLVRFPPASIHSALALLLVLNERNGASARPPFIYSPFSCTGFIYDSVRTDQRSPALRQAHLTTTALVRGYGKGAMIIAMR
jgi:hypothetical protein